MDYLEKQIQDRARTFPKGNIVLFQGEVPRNGYLVVSGTLKVYAIDNDGNDRVVDFLSKGDVFPLDWMSDVVKSSVFYVETLTESELKPIAKQHFMELRKNDAHFQEDLLSQLEAATTTSLIRNLALEQSLATNKIIYLFYYFAIRYGKEVMSGLFNLGLPLTHQLIAECLGLTRETVAGELSRLKKSGTIAYRQRQYIVDKKLLIKAVGKDISDNFETER